MSNKQFSDRLNKELDTIGLPSLSSDRIEAFAKLMKVPKFKAESMLNGIVLPEGEFLVKLAAELEVNPEWLVYRSDQRTKKGKKE